MNFLSELTSFGANWDVMQFLCSVYLEKNSKNFTVDCPYYFQIFIRFHEFWLIMSLVIFESILSNCVKSNNKDWVWLIMHSFCAFWAKQGHLRGNEYLWTFMELLAWLMRKKKTSIQFGSMFMSFESIMDFYKENTKFNELNIFYWVQ